MRDPPGSKPLRVVESGFGRASELRFLLVLLLIPAEDLLDEAAESALLFLILLFFSLGRFLRFRFCCSNLVGIGSWRRVSDLRLLRRGLGHYRGRSITRLRCSSVPRSRRIRTRRRRLRIESRGRDGR